MDLTFDTSNLDELMRWLPLRRRHRILQNALRSVAAKCRRQVMAVAARQFATRPRAGKPRKQGATGRAWSRKSSPRRDVAKGVQSCVYKRDVGFKIDIYPAKGSKSPVLDRFMHTNRQGLKKPVLLFVNSSTESSRATHWGNRNRGVLPQKPFLKTAAATVDPFARSEFEKIMIESTRKIAAKYGARLS